MPGNLAVAQGASGIDAGRERYGCFRRPISIGMVWGDRAARFRDGDEAIDDEAIDDGAIDDGAIDDGAIDDGATDDSLGAQPLPARAQEA
jgi:hypothetical protein